MRRDSKALLETAIQAVRAGEPGAMQMAASAARVVDRLGIDSQESLQVETIQGCDDVQQLRASYCAGALSSTRVLLIQAHLHDCGACRRAYADAGTSALDWFTPRPASAFAWSPRALRWAFVPCLAALVVTFFIYRAFWQVPPGVRAEVRSIDGAAYRISDAGDRQLSVGDTLQEGDHLRTSGGAHAVLRLADGSSVEVNERTVLTVGARGRNMTVAVDDGAVIVQAAKRASGHLYVKTPDCRVAVTGTVFSVDAGIKGSRVAVLEGSLHVTHSGVDTLMHAGEQVTTSDNLSPEPVDQEIAWSYDRDKYLQLLGQFNVLQRRIDQIPTPQLRYTSDLLARVPGNTLLYISMPNFGGFLSEANTIFHDQLKQSPVLQQWWNSGTDRNTADLDALVEKIHQISGYLGDEVVVVGVRQANGPGFAVLADLQRSGLGDFLKQQTPGSGSMPSFVVLDDASLAAAPLASQAQPGGYALIRQHEAVFSNSIAVLKQLSAQLNAGASGFASGDFGQQITSAYGRGAGIILAADVQQMTKIGHSRQLDKTGLNDVRYLIAEHRETNGLPENHVSLQFAGTRQGVASWLAAPAPIGSLEFVTPNASVAVALLSKDPAEIADDMMSMATRDGASGKAGWSDAQARLQVDIRNDLAANLGGDFLLSLDGPVLPRPAWKAVIEVRNAEQIESALERLTSSMHSLSNGKQAHDIVIRSSQVNDQRFYSLHDLVSGSTVAEYTFADGYMILGPDRALLMQALHVHSSGDSLARSAAFKALLPKDENANYSAIAYQNIGPAMTPLLSQFSGATAEALRQMAADARPTAICAWGEDNRIEAASNSRLFGFDLLALGPLIRDGNKQAGANVRD